MILVLGTVKSISRKTEILNWAPMENWAESFDRTYEHFCQVLAD